MLICQSVILSWDRCCVQARYSDEVDDAISAVVRIDMESNVANPGVQGVYVMSKNGDTTQFDYWAAMRDGRLNVGPTSSRSSVKGLAKIVPGSPPGPRAHACNAHGWASGGRGSCRRGGEHMPSLLVLALPAFYLPLSVLCVSCLSLSGSLFLCLFVSLFLFLTPLSLSLSFFPPPPPPFSLSLSPTLTFFPLRSLSMSLFLFTQCRRQCRMPARTRPRSPLALLSSF